MLLAFFIFNIFRPDSISPNAGNDGIRGFIWSLKPVRSSLTLDLAKRQTSCIPFFTWHQVHTRCRAPPLLNLRLKTSTSQISEESEEIILITRYFRKKDPVGSPDAVEWIEMSGQEFYRFVTDPQNKNRYFHNMGDVVLECTEAEYKKFKVEDDHSSYISEQEEGVTILSLDAWDQPDLLNAINMLADTDIDVEEHAIQNIMKQELRKALQSLSQQDAWIIEELYLAKPHKTLRQLSAESKIPVMTLQDRKTKILATLQAAIAPPNIFSKNSKKLRTKSQKVHNRKV